MQIPVLYRDEHCLIVDKPNNMLVHHSHYARNIETLSLVEQLQEQGLGDCYPVHRLDHKTSGLLLLTQSREKVALFQELFASGEITKSYKALLRGFAPPSGIIDSPVKNERGNYKDAYTEYSCLQQFELDMPVQPYATARYSLVEFVPRTGRMHQLRIHANKISHPIIGDPKHGNRHHNHFFQLELGLPDLFLHAYQLTFQHPFTGEVITVQAPLPSFWNSFFRLAAEFGTKQD